MSSRDGWHLFQQLKQQQQQQIHAQQQQQQQQQLLVHQNKVVFSPNSPLSPLEGGWSSSSASGCAASSAGSGSPPGISSASNHSSFNRGSSDEEQFQLALREIESKLLEDDDYDDQQQQQLLQQEHQADDEEFENIITRERVEMAMEDPATLLLLCAETIGSSNFVMADHIVAKLNTVVNIYGTPIQRLAAYMVEGLVAKVKSTGTGLCKALRCREPSSTPPKQGEILSAMQVMYEVCPYIKFGYMAANGAIAEAFKDEKRVHIIDFEIAQGTQYIALIQALSMRPDRPSLRITGVGDPTADVAAPGGVAIVGQRLSKLAASVGVPFEFIPVSANASTVTSDMLGRRDFSEALAINFAMQLHHMPDESVSIANPRDRLLRLAKSLQPKIVTIVEQEANTNTAPFLARFREALSYYSAVFESLDVTLPRQSKERVSVEQHCLARDLVNLIACEGADRVERHEVMGKWKSRLTMAGFRQCPLSSHVNNTISCLLKSYCEKYKLSEENGVIYLGWQDRSLVSASAWC